MRIYQQGSVNLPYNDDDLDLDIDVSYAGIWRSVNDHVNYRAGIEGYGNVEQTWRRKEITSEWFKGSYCTGQVQDNTKRALQVYVRGQTIADMADARERLLLWFTQDEYQMRIRTDDLLETMECECADYRVDMTHVFLHNRMCVVTLNYSVRPTVDYEMVF